MIGLVGAAVVHASSGGPGRGAGRNGNKMAAKLSVLGRSCVVASLVSAAALGGCDDGTRRWPWTRQTEAAKRVPYPINLLLPKRIEISRAFTGTRLFAKTGARGVEVNVKVLDAYGDATKAFGHFRFSLYAFRHNNTNRRGKLLHTWDVRLTDAKKNRVHWYKVAHTYRFQLECRRALPTGQKFVLEAIFTSPFTERLTGERTLIAGQ